MGERTRYDPGAFCWVGLATSDVAAAKAFYGSLFGWQPEDLEAGAAGAYTTLHRGGSEVAILYLALAVIGVPLAATAAGWLLAGTEPPAIARTVIE